MPWPGVEKQREQFVTVIANNISRQIYLFFLPLIPTHPARQCTNPVRVTDGSARMASKVARTCVLRSVAAHG